MNPILKNHAPPVCLAVILYSIIPTLAVCDGLEFSEGFENYRPDEPITNGRFGDRGWKASGIMESDAVTVTGAAAFEGQKALLLADHDKGRPRIGLDLLSTQVVQSRLVAGRLTFAIKEADDDGEPDAYLIEVGRMSLLRKIDQPAFWFRVEHAAGKTVPFKGVAYNYTPGTWNTFSLEFNDQIKSVILSINGVVAVTIDEPSADYSVGSLTFGTYSSTGVGNAIFIDAIKLEEPSEQ